MSSAGAEDDSSRKLAEPNEAIQEEKEAHQPFPLLSLPLELRERIYIHHFEKIRAGWYTAKLGSPKNVLAILGTSTRIRKEASAVLFDRTPLRFMIGSNRSMASKPPPQEIIDRFHKVYFKIEKIGSTHPCYEFATLWEPLTKALTSSSSPPPQQKRSCYIQCEMEEYGAGHSNPYLRDGLKLFTAFETVTVDFEVLTPRARYRMPPPKIPTKESEAEDARWAGMVEREWQQQPAALAAVEKMFRLLQRDLGKGSMIDLPGDWYLLYGRRIEFHPLLNKKD